ncbi:hypothetical protein AMYT_a0149 (plasmid) [Malaciobacter mytili LMG 24559]|uniref:hypothetical protein n=1 Tax=Malaciobacter mytili TaxID=603050 RepID=UPI000E102DF8|nr:hypothetical protein [Malaciobacter mytili]AXH16447.1 hypothetical protein AMYT_a0149 [Malaciobacter mytili LMG 24559]
MASFGFYLFMCVIAVLYANSKGEFDKFIKDKNYEKVKELEIKLEKIKNKYPDLDIQ